MTQRTQNPPTAQELWELYIEAASRADAYLRGREASWAAYEHAADAERQAHRDAVTALDRYLVVILDRPTAAAVPANTDRTQSAPSALTAD